MALKTTKPRVAVLDTRRVKPSPKVADEFYTSSAWRALLRSIIAERGRRCEKCGKTGVRIYGDHIVELKDGGAPLDRRNCQLLCASCHTRKTAAERAKRMSL